MEPIRCEECGGKYIGEADKCPHCGSSQDPVTPDEYGLADYEFHQGN